MASAQIGALRVVLGADTAQFEKGMGSANRRLDSFGKTAARVAVGLAAVLTTALSGLSIGVRNTLGHMDAMAKAAQKIGIPVEELIRLEHAADLAGVSLETLNNGVGRLSRNMNDAADGLKAPQRAFDQLGINIRNSEGQLKSMSEILPEIADRFASMKDGTEKTAIAMVLLGRSGRELIPLLNAGGEGLNALKAEADALGLVFDTKTAQAAEQFNDTLNRLGKVSGGLVTQVTAKMLPALNALAGTLFENVKNSTLLRDTMSFLGKVLEGLVRVTAFLFDNISALGKVLLALVTAKIATAVAGIAVAFVKFAMSIRSAGLALAAFHAIKRASLTTFLFLAAGIALATGNLDKFTGAVGQVAEKVKTLLPEDLPAHLTETLGSLGLNIEALTADFSSMSLEVPVTADAFDQLDGSLNRTAGSTNALRDSMHEAASVIASTRTPLEQYRAQLEQIKRLQAEGAVDADTFARTQTMATAQVAGQYLQLASQVGQAFGTMFDDNKAVAIAQATINTLQGITQALAQYPPPFSFGMAAAVAATGFAQVAKIRSTSSKGGGGRSSISRGGGSGSGRTPSVDASRSVSSGRDSVMSSQPQAVAQSPAVHITLQGNSNTKYTRDEVIDLIRQIAEVQGDSSRVTVN